MAEPLWLITGVVDSLGRWLSDLGLGFVNLLTNWSALNRMGRSRVLRSSIFWLFAVPMAAKALVKVNDTLSFTIFGAEVVVNMSLPFSWQMFYFASVAFGIGTLMYMFFCPSMIRDYDRFSDFRDQGKGARQLGLAWRAVGRGLPMSVGEELDGRINRAARSHDLLEYSGSPTDPISDDEFSAVFFLIREGAEHIRPIPRVFCAMCYVIGFAFISIVLYQNFITVILLFATGGGFSVVT